MKSQKKNVLLVMLLALAVGRLPAMGNNRSEAQEKKSAASGTSKRLTEEEKQELKSFIENFAQKNGGSVKPLEIANTFLTNSGKRVSRDVVLYYTPDNYLHTIASNDRLTDAEKQELVAAIRSYAQAHNNIINVSAIAKNFRASTGKSVSQPTVKHYLSQAAPQITLRKRGRLQTVEMANSVVVVDSALEREQQNLKHELKEAIIRKKYLPSPAKFAKKWHKKHAHKIDADTIATLQQEICREEGLVVEAHLSPLEEHCLICDLNNAVNTNAQFDPETFANEWATRHGKLPGNLEIRALIAMRLPA